MKLIQLTSDIILTEDERHNTIVRNQSASNLSYIALNKIRSMLGPMGLVKGGKIEKHRVTEPLPEAVTPFNKLRQAVKNRIQQDEQDIRNGNNVQQIGQFWGIDLPGANKDPWADTERGQVGRTHVQGTFDNMIRDVVKKSSMTRDISKKIELLNQLAQSL